MRLIVLYLFVFQQFLIASLVIAETNPLQRQDSYNILRDVRQQISQGNLRMVILTESSILKYDSFFLTDEMPPKLVIDLTGNWMNSGKSVYKLENDVVESVRIGEHIDYLRIVLDLKIKDELFPVFQESSEGLILTLRKSSQIKILPLKQEPIEKINYSPIKPNETDIGTDETLYLDSKNKSDHSFADYADTLYLKGRNDTSTLDMNLAEAVFLALRNNRNIKSAYLDRVTEKFDLKVAEDKFIPDIKLEGNIGYFEKHSRTDGNSNTLLAENTDGYIKAIFSEKIPTGADFAFTWNSDFKELGGDSQGGSETDFWQISLKQPLLRGGGIDVNTASLNIARYQEQQNILDLKSKLINTITETIFAYRNFQKVSNQVKISKLSLKRSEDNLEVNKTMSVKGRLEDIIQAEADVANQRFFYYQRLNALDNGRLELIKYLDIDKHVQILPAEKVQIEQIEPNFERSMRIALANRSDYLKEVLKADMAKLDLQLAQNNKLWDLSLDAYYKENNKHFESEADQREDEWRVSLSGSIPIYGDLARKQRYLNAEISLKKIKISLKEIRENIKIEVTDAIRNIKLQMEQIRLAERVRELSEKKLDIEQKKLKEGRSTNFQIVTFQDDLVEAQTNELNAKIEYLNALTHLDQILGTTLDTWKIEFKDR